MHGPSFALLIGLAVLLGYNFTNSLGERRFEIDLRSRLSRLIAARPGAYLADLRIAKNNDKTLVTAVVRAPWAYSPSETASIEATLPPVTPPVELHIRSIITKEATSNGWINQPPSTPSTVDIGPGVSQ